MAGKVKIRTVSNWSIVTTIILAALCVIISILGFKKYVVLRTAMQDYISCETAVHQLQDGSDNLTKQVRLAAATGEQKYIDAYFEEVNVTKSRERALDDLAALGGETDAIEVLQEALSSSVELMQTEYYSMRLIEEATGTDPSVWPEEIKTVKVLPEDEGLSPAEKLSKAQQIVISPDYENAKDIIYNNTNATLGALTREISSRQSYAANIFTDVFRKIIMYVLIFAAMMLLICLIMRFWIVIPLLIYNDKIQQGSRLPLRGANEIQTLAKTYNEVYEENEEREKLMKHQAEHDPLTGALNRGSFDRILSLYEKDKRNFALILIDVDVFKKVNDTYGHDAGDMILKKVAGLLRSAFRNIDYVCRIGGDEFAIIMVDMTIDLSYTIIEKITEVNRQLAIPEDGNPLVSLSAGAAFTDWENPDRDLFKAADSALYHTKEHGRSGCHFFHDIVSD